MFARKEGCLRRYWEALTEEGNCLGFLMFASPLSVGLRVFGDKMILYLSLMTRRPLVTVLVFSDSDQVYFKLVGTLPYSW